MRKAAIIVGWLGVISVLGLFWWGVVRVVVLFFFWTPLGFGCALHGRQAPIHYRIGLAQLVKLTDKVDGQASQIAALTATLEAIKTRPRWCIARI